MEPTRGWFVKSEGEWGQNNFGESLGVVIEVSLTFKFLTSNNQAEYEACIASLRLALELQVPRVNLSTNSLLVVSQIGKKYEAKDLILQKYLTQVCELLARFQVAEVKHVPRLENVRADILSKLANTKAPGNH